MSPACPTPCSRYSPEVRALVDTDYPLLNFKFLQIFPSILRTIEVVRAFCKCGSHNRKLIAAHLNCYALIEGERKHYVQSISTPNPVDRPDLGLVCRRGRHGVSANRKS